MSYVNELGRKAKQAEVYLAKASAKMKNKALQAISEALVENADLIITQNSIDIENAIRNDMSVVMQDRLSLDKKRIQAMADAVLELINLDDPIGETLSGTIRPNGLNIRKVRVPLGVIAIIYESRPNVTADAATLCLKTGNAVILRGGKEAYYSNKCIVGVMRKALHSTDFPEDAIQFVDDTGREASTELMKCSEYVDVLIPRGGAGLIKACVNNATVPVIQTGVGNCHIYVDSSADLKMAAEIVNNGKTSRPSVCNAVENLIVHKDIAEEFLPMIKNLLDEHRVEIRGCEKTRAILGDEVIPVTNEDYNTEFLDYIIAVKVVNNIDEAIKHISKYTTHHSEAIITESLNNAEKFQMEIDAAAVYVNASTRFTDGGEFGFGAEIGISTQKLHARGPMGLKELTSTKYLVNGNGQIR